MKYSVGLVDVDSKVPNLALMKISAYYKKKGWDVELTSPLFADSFDKIYASKVFSYTEKPTLPERTILGGTGHSLKTKLNPEIEIVLPDYSLYPDMEYSVGFTTRGCVRNCKFCVVPEKEGKIKAVADIDDIWNRKHKNIVLYDNNILALPEHFYKIAKQLKEYNLTVDFNQGLDHRLLTENICKTLHGLSHIEYRFSFDLIQYEKSVLKAINLLKHAGINRSFWYVLVGFNTTIKEDLYRLNLLREHNQNVFVQRYNKINKQIYIPIARWANQHHVFKGMTWKQFLRRPENKKYQSLFK